MPKLAQVSVRLLGVFAVEAKTARTIPVLIRSRKARALFAYLAMKPDYRASREEVATLLWSDSLDAHARHSLSQCLTSLRQDLRLAPELLFVEREMIGIRAKELSVDARELLALAKSSKEEDLNQASELYRGEFLPDLTLDIEEFDSWDGSRGTCSRPRRRVCSRALSVRRRARRRRTGHRHGRTAGRIGLDARGLAAHRPWTLRPLPRS